MWYHIRGQVNGGAQYTISQTNFDWPSFEEVVPGTTNQWCGWWQGECGWDWQQTTQQVHYLRFGGFHNDTIFFRSAAVAPAEPSKKLYLGYDAWRLVYEVSSYDASTVVVQILNQSNAVLYQKDYANVPWGDDYLEVWDGTWNQGDNNGVFANPLNGPYTARLIMTTRGGVAITNNIVETTGKPATVDLMAKAVLDNEFFEVLIGHSGHLKTMTDLLKSCGFNEVVRIGDLTDWYRSYSRKFRFIEAAPKSLILYVLSHGAVDASGAFLGPQFEDTGEVLFPPDLPKGLKCRLMFFNGCASGAGGNADAFYQKGGGANFTIYAGWEHEAKGVDLGIVANMARDLFESIAAGNTVKAAAESALHSTPSTDLPYIQGSNRTSLQCK